MERLHSNSHFYLKISKSEKFKNGISFRNHIILHRKNIEKTHEQMIKHVKSTGYHT